MFLNRRCYCYEVWLTYSSYKSVVKEIIKSATTRVYVKHLNFLHFKKYNLSIIYINRSLFFYNLADYIQVLVVIKLILS